MSLLKKNSYIPTILAFSFIFILYILLTDDDIATYEQINIEYGDTLWMLADSYSGKMDKMEWIALVKKMNYLHTDDLMAGQQLVVPVVSGSHYFASQTATHQSITVASDNQWKMQ
ncbi:MAG: LysM peptidoglycan-binding domain-containing protein [Solibacillus sp.]